MEFRHIHIPAMFIAVILGYELCYYFLFKYYAKKDEKLKLNKILLVLGVLYGFLVTSIFMRLIINYYIAQTLLNDILAKVTTMIFLLGFIFLLIINLSKELEEITIPILTKLLIVLNFLPFLTIIFFPLDSIEFRLSLIPNTLALIYVLYIHLNLIKKSTGSIKRRLILILIGENLVALGIIFGGEDSGLILDLQYIEVVYMIAILTSILGMLIVFIAIYDFPSFLEFDWRENLICLYIIDEKKYNLLYSFDFLSLSTEDKRYHLTEKKMSEVFSKGVIGIEEVAHLITKSEKKQVEKITQGEVLILLSHGDSSFSHIIFILLVKKEMNSFNYILQSIKKNFQTSYKSIISNIESIKDREKEVFSSFDDNLKNILAIY